MPPAHGLVWWLPSTISLLSILSLGCSWSLGPCATHSLAGPENSQVGAAGAAYLRLPRSYRWIAGGESAWLSQWSPANYGSQWRLLMAGGYASLPAPSAGPVGLEALAVAGYTRGSVGSLLGPGAPVLGGKIGIPFRLTSRQDPWQADAVLQTTPYLVPQLGINELLVFDRQGRVRPQTEAAATLSFRLVVGSSLFP